MSKTKKQQPASLAEADCSVADLKSSLAAIHYHASRSWGDKIAHMAKMLAIRDECERCIPELRRLRPPNSERRDGQP